MVLTTQKWNSLSIDLQNVGYMNEFQILVLDIRAPTVIVISHLEHILSWHCPERGPSYQNKRKFDHTEHKIDRAAMNRQSSVK